MAFDSRRTLKTRRPLPVLPNFASLSPHFDKYDSLLYIWVAEWVPDAARGCAIGPKKAE
jgi:hypothetical protein